MGRVRHRRSPWDGSRDWVVGRVRFHSRTRVRTIASKLNNTLAADIDGSKQPGEMDTCEDRSGKLRRRTCFKPSKIRMGN
jgi:hypothetical protein